MPRSSRDAPTARPSAEGGLGAAVDDLQEQLAHGGIDGVAHKVGVQRFENGLADQYLGSHGSRMGHARAADGLDQSLLNDALLDVERQLAGALLGRAPADTVGKAGNIGDLLGLDPLALFGDRGRAVICALCDGTHMLDFGRINHNDLPFLSSVSTNADIIRIITIANCAVFCKAKKRKSRQNPCPFHGFSAAKCTLLTADAAQGAGQCSIPHTARALPTAASFLQTARRIPCRRRAGRGGSGRCTVRSPAAARH